TIAATTVATRRRAMTVAMIPLIHGCTSASTRIASLTSPLARSSKQVVDRLPSWSAVGASLASVHRVAPARNVPPAFLFATGIENSYPTIDGGRTRVDEMEKCRHYELWRTDFALVQELGISYVRYGPPIHRTWLGPERYDWEFADLTFAELHRLDLVPITD